MRRRGGVIALGLALTGVVAVGCDAAVTTPSEREEWDRQTAGDEEDLRALYDELIPEVLQAAGIDEVVSASLLHNSCGGAPWGPAVQVALSVNAEPPDRKIELSAADANEFLAERGWLLDDVAKKSVVKAEKDGVAFYGEVGPAVTPLWIEGPCRETSQEYADEFTDDPVVDELGAPGEGGTS